VRIAVVFVRQSLLHKARAEQRLPLGPWWLHMKPQSETFPSRGSVSSLSELVSQLVRHPSRPLRAWNRSVAPFAGKDPRSAFQAGNSPLSASPPLTRVHSTYHIAIDWQREVDDRSRCRKFPPPGRFASPGFREDSAPRLSAVMLQTPRGSP
jgi:hypothetical protein